MLPIAPLTFLPLFKERIWGGRSLATLYGKELPAGLQIGESWELTDRPEGISVISSGPLAGKTLHDLVELYPEELLGKLLTQEGRFPWLMKLLDARDNLSLQVHPPASKAAALNGQPKTELWYVADADPGAQIHVGLLLGITRKEFEARTQEGSVAACFHHHTAHKGAALFLPSGRVHALGAGTVVFEIQQNSDTTYRVFDWNRVGLDGKPRDLHLQQAFESIDFQDTCPALVPELWSRAGDGVTTRPLVHYSLFDVDLFRFSPGASLSLLLNEGPLLAGCIDGSLEIIAGSGTVPLISGGFSLIPAIAGSSIVTSRHTGGLMMTVRRHCRY
ncbi:MAG: mannose-6-phosphate isomerase [Pedosphaera sp.]|nr:mannose-6-phosphate isomerase [Pedosphaera sp.]